MFYFLFLWLIHFIVGNLSSFIPCTDFAWLPWGRKRGRASLSFGHASAHPPTNPHGVLGWSPVVGVTWRQVGSDWLCCGVVANYYILPLGTRQTQNVSSRALPSSSCPVPGRQLLGSQLSCILYSHQANEGSDCVPESC